MSVRVRFAPSPTGYLHLGGARTALFNWAYARRHGGKFILRIEDTDLDRSTPEATQAILDSMKWLGIAWDEGPEVGGAQGPYFQTERRALYREHAEALLVSGKAYRCYCTAEELEARRQSQTQRREPPRYDWRCRELDAAARARFEAEGRGAAIRYALSADGGETGWDDLVRERVAFPNDVLDDFVILCTDGLPTYKFACVVDDHAMVRQIIRPKERSIRIGCRTAIIPRGRKYTHRKICA